MGENRLHSCSEVAAGRLDICVPSTCAQWIVDAACPNRSVVLLDTDAAGEVAHEVKTCGATHNPFEVQACALFARTLVQAGLPSSDVLFISPLRRQLNALEVACKGDPILAGVETLTVDRSQGRSARCVVVSFVRSNAEGRVGELLCDWRRLNVALSRAKHKLVLVCSASTLVSDKALDGSSADLLSGRRKVQELVQLCKKESWVVPMF